MKKLDKLYVAALRATARTIRRTKRMDLGDWNPHAASTFKDPESRAGLMKSARRKATQQLKEHREQARFKKGCSKAFFDAYLETALWSSTDNADDSGGEPLDRNYSVSDFTQDALRKAKKDCDNFHDYAREELAATGASDSQNGHDFWLTRNRHGAGFWDRGYDHALGEELKKKSQSFGEVHIFVSRGRLHYEG